MKSILILIFIFIIICIPKNSYSQTDPFSKIPAGADYPIIVRMINGDVLTGYIVEIVRDSEGTGVRLHTELGTATVYSSQVSEVKLSEDYYRQNHRIFLLPTAEPIRQNLFVGVFEMLFLYGGFGVSDFLSVTAGRTALPAIRSKEQGTELNIKWTILNGQLDSNVDFGNLSLAVGGNLAFVNDRNRLIHYYAAATFKLARTSVTADIFYKAGSNDFYTLTFAQNSLNMIYGNGAFGIGVGLDTRIPKHNDIHFIGELWNSDVSKPTNSAVMLGLRLCNTDFSADFGLAFFTQPFAAPFMSFVWTPL